MDVPTGAGDWGCDHKELENWKPGSTSRGSCLQEIVEYQPVRPHTSLVPAGEPATALIYPRPHPTCWLAAQSPSSRINITSLRMDERDFKEIITSKCNDKAQNVMTRFNRNS